MFTQQKFYKILQLQILNRSQISETVNHNNIKYTISCKNKKININHYISRLRFHAGNSTYQLKSNFQSFKDHQERNMKLDKSPNFFMSFFIKNNFHVVPTMSDSV